MFRAVLIEMMMYATNCKVDNLQLMIEKAKQLLSIVSRVSHLFVNQKNIVVFPDTVLKLKKKKIVFIHSTFCLGNYSSAQIY